MKKIFGSLIVASLIFAIACNPETKDSAEIADKRNEQKADSVNMSDKLEDDHEFMVDITSGGLMEVELGKLAAENALSPQVKEFGKTMVNDHTKSNEKLRSLAVQKNISIPSTPGEDHLQRINDLRTKKNADFDKAYINMMIKDHDIDVRKFEDAANNAKDTDIKAFASETLPVLKQHREMARSIKDKLK